MKNKIDIKKVNLFELLKEVNGSTIPYYQRNYNWGENEVDRLIYDLLNNKTDEYFFGNIIIHGYLGTKSIVDGQQRISTFLLFMKCFEKYNYFNEQEKYLINTYEIISQNLHDKEVLQDILKNSTNESKYEKSSYYTNFLHIKKEIEKLTSEKRDVLFTRLQNTILSLIHINDDYDEYRLFTNINSTGLPLNAYDLIKNFMFSKMNLNSNEVEEKLKYLNEITHYLEFNKIGNKVEPREKTKNMNQLVKAFLVFQTGEVFKEEANMLFREFEQNYFKNYESQNKGIDNLFDDFIKFGVFYKFVKQGNIENYSFRKPFRIIDLQIDTFLSLVIDILETHFTYNKFELNLKIDLKQEQQVYDSFLIIEAYILFRVMLGKRSNDLSRFIPTIKNKIKNSPNVSYAANLLKILYIDKMNEDKNNIKMPSKKEFYNVLINSNIYDNKTKYCLNLLIRINEFFDLHNTNKYETKHIEIEHILPQNISKWRENGVNLLDQDHEHYLNTLGNLTLLVKSLNREIKNDVFQIKKNSFLDKDSYIMNNYFKKLDEWNIEQIKSRSEYLIKNCIEKIFNFESIYKELGLENENVDLQNLLYNSTYLETANTKTSTQYLLSNLKTFTRFVNFTQKIIENVIYQFCVENKSVRQISLQIYPKDSNSLIGHAILNLLKINTTQTSIYRNKTKEEYFKIIKEKSQEIESLINNLKQDFN